MAISILIVYLMFINAYTFTTMGLDKKYAKKQNRRVPEKRMFLLSAIGGAGGTWLGMKKWRHKTKHLTFTVGIPSLFILNILLILVVVWLIGLNANS